MKILFLGDIVGRPGRQIVKHFIPILRKHHILDLVIANAENAAGGTGIDYSTADELLTAGVDIITLGNHVWKRRETPELLKQNSQRIIRPLNFPTGVPGVGLAKFITDSGVTINVVNLIGRIFMDEVTDCPFQIIDHLLKNKLKDEKIVFIDFHAEATSEKNALAWFLDGRVTALCGTHTHVQTADERIFPQGLAFISDAGMCGAKNGILGVDYQPIVKKFLTGMPVKFEVPKGSAILNGVIVSCDESSGRAMTIERIYEQLL
ncbi:MAG: TIGR00282 family metallophosphoesterase [Deltaproteobacteria bacterium]|nr:TIGR00282 family metallophosphoesterase [Deltaproteobacteria bacterium]